LLAAAGTVKSGLQLVCVDTIDAVGEPLIIDRAIIKPSAVGKTKAAARKGMCHIFGALFGAQKYLYRL
jgi:hypothetical protein